MKRFAALFLTVMLMCSMLIVPVSAAKGNDFRSPEYEEPEIPVIPPVDPPVDPVDPVDPPVDPVDPPVEPVDPPQSPQTG